MKAKNTPGNARSPPTLVGGEGKKRIAAQGILGSTKQQQQMEITMQIVNGKHEPDMEMEDDEMAPEAEGKPKKPWQPPAHVITRGNVVTRIWANPNHWGEITWRVDQRVMNLGTASRWYGKSIPGDCLQNAVRGLYRAQVWISRAGNPRGLWRFLPWNWF